MQKRGNLYLNQCSREAVAGAKAQPFQAPYAALKRRSSTKRIKHEANQARNKSSRPTVPCDGPRMNRQVDVGNPPRPFRHLRMTERRTPDPSSSRVPVHSALVQKSVTAITNPAGRLSLWMLGELAVN